MDNKPNMTYEGLKKFITEEKIQRPNYEALKAAKNLLIFAGNEKYYEQLAKINAKVQIAWDMGCFRGQ